MFYSQFILAKKGPLGTIWIAAHLERKLRKNQVADTDIGVSVDSILSPDVPIALRLSSHLLLGVVRIYSRKVNYLFHDCSETLLKVKQAFRSTAVDLPPEESTAPYHSITLPETFDLDDFELPDSDNFEGSFVDHHVSTKEQITLQDSMDGVVYSTSQFGLDERFGDGDTSQGLDLDEELFLDKVTARGHTVILLESDNVDPQASRQPMTPFMEMDVDVDDDDITESTQCAPCNSGVVEEVLPTNGLFDHGHVNTNLQTNFEEVIMQDLTDDLQYESEYRDPNLLTPEDLISKGLHIGDMNEAGDCSLLDNKISETDVTHVALDTQAKQQGDSPAVVDTFDVGRTVSSPTSVLTEQPKPTSPASGTLDRASNLPEILEKTETPQSGDIIIENHCSSDFDHIHAETVTAQDTRIDTAPASTLVETCNEPLPSSESVSPNCKPANECQTVPADTLQTGCVSHEETLGTEALAKLSQAGDLPEFSVPYAADPLFESVSAHEFHKDEIGDCLGLETHHLVSPKLISFENQHVLRACHSLLKQPDTSVPEDRDLEINVPDLSSTGPEPCPLATLGQQDPAHTSGISTLLQGEECQPTSIRYTDLSNLDEGLGTVISKDRQEGNINCQASYGLAVPEPERMLSAPAPAPFAPSELLLPFTSEKEVFTEPQVSGNGFRTLSGRKHNLMETAETQQDGGSANFLLTRSNINLATVPDDDDLLASILVGRQSSVLKLRPTPRQSEIISRKRPRLTSRTSVPKRKVLLDDTMVLHGDTIRQQLTSTEDIRRIRKKAPCTRPEIWMIQKHLLEDDIFVESLFTGMSPDLVGVHNRTYVVTDFRVSAMDVDHTFPEVPEDILLSKSSDLIGEANIEGAGQPAVQVGIGGEANEPMEDHLLNSIEGDSQEQAKHVLDTFPVDSQNALADTMPSADVIGSEFPLLTAVISEDRCNGTVGFEAESLPADRSNGEETVLQNDGNSDIHSVEKDVFIMERIEHGGDDAIHVTEINEDILLFADFDLVEKDGSVQKVSESGSLNVAPQHIPQDDQVDVREGFPPPLDAMLDYCLVENRADVLADASTPLENDKPLFSNTVLGSEGPADPIAVTDDHVKDGISSELGHVTRDENVRDGAGNSPINLMSIEDPQDFSVTLEFDASTEVVSSDQGKYPNSQEADMGWTVDVENLSNEVANVEGTVNEETTALDNASANLYYDHENAVDENDTDFLNFDDDDEENEEEDNSMPNAEEVFGTLDTSGWSSRTRGVARYLQTQFDGEFGHGRKVLSVDSLLSGKTRKEASRMFFETLVLKTRDYIHVEQENPFDIINIKPKGKLVKSDF